MLKPIDIHNAEFKRSFKGYNEEEVDAFLAKVVSEYENLYQENVSLKESVRKLEQELSQQGTREQDIYRLIALTKETVAEAKEVARNQASEIVAAAKRKAEAEVAENEQRLREYQSRLAAMQRQEQKFKERLREVMESVWRQVESLQTETIGQPEAAAAAQRPRTASRPQSNTKIFAPDPDPDLDNGEDGELEESDDKTRIYRTDFRSQDD